MQTQHSFDSSLLSPSLQADEAHVRTLRTALSDIGSSSSGIGSSTMTALWDGALVTAMGRVVAAMGREPGTGRGRLPGRSPGFGLEPMHDMARGAALFHASDSGEDCELARTTEEV